MKRKDFFREMRKSFTQTVKSISSPIIEEEIDKLTNAADRAIGIRWHFFSDERDIQDGMIQRFVSGKPVLLWVDQRNMQALSAICPACSHLLAFTPLYATGKCLICEKDYNFKRKEGNLEFTEYPVRKEKGRVYVGLIP